MAVDQTDREAEIAKEIADATDGAGFLDVMDQLSELRRSGMMPLPRNGLESPHGSGMSRLTD